MKWYEGSIPAAIQESRDRRAVFIVYVSGEDDISVKMNATWDSPAVSEACEKHRCVGLKVEAKSETCTQFSQIYPVVVVPSTYFIGLNGYPLEVTGGVVEPDEFAQKIEKVAQMYKDQAGGQPQAPAASANPPSPTAAQPSQSQPQGDTQTEASAEVVSDSQPGTSPMEAESSQSPPHGDSQEGTSAEGAAVEDGEPPEKKPTIDEKMKRANELLAQKRAEKAEKEAAETKRKEDERRDLGRGLNKLRQFKEEQEAKEIREKIKKDKEDDRRAREKVREQIARDRAERAAKYQKAKTEQDQAKQAAKETKEAAQKELDEKEIARRRETARIQFRMPDGSTVTHQFPSSQPLSAARDFIRQEVGSTYGDFILSTTFPKRDFTEADMSQSLLDLQLAPSAAIILVPGSQVSSLRGQSTGTGGGGGGFIWMLLAPLVALWNFIYNFLFGAPATPPPVQSSQSNTATNTQTSQPQAQTRLRGGNAQQLRSRQEGNIRRFTNMDDDDESATWNGNSTQQM